MAVIEINWNPEPKQLRVFALLQAVFFSLVAWGIFARGNGNVAPASVLGVSLIVCIVGVLRPRAVRPLYVLWMAAVLPIGWTVSHLLLAAIFFLFITPVGRLMRLCGYDSMHRRFDRRAKTYWKSRNETRGIRRYFKQY